jgi:hypothetical protein
MRLFSNINLSFALPAGLLVVILLFLYTKSVSQNNNTADITPQDTLNEQLPNVYLDCYFCDHDHIKRKVGYVNYVRDRKDADVHIMVARERAANRGVRYSFFMLGQNGYIHLQDTLRVNLGPDVSEEETRQRVVHAIKAGLVPYLIKTPMWKKLTIGYTEPSETAEPTDRWNYWIFELSSDVRMQGEESTKSLDLGGEIEANKVTEAFKLEFEFDADYEKSIYEVESETITSIHRTYDFEGLAVKSISPHLSAGGFAEVYSSRYRNIKISYDAAPAIEYNIFPYSEATTRQLTFLYRPEYEYNRYQDTTIYNKLQENLFREILSIDYEIKKKWGSIDLALDLSHYFHDFSKNRVSFRTSFNVNIVKGLNVYFYGGASLIHDQLSLPKGEATREEVLTRQQQLATSYEYYTSFGISYTFGSMYNNIVNPRF